MKKHWKIIAWKFLKILVCQNTKTEVKNLQICHNIYYIYIDLIVDAKNIYIIKPVHKQEANCK